MLKYQMTRSSLEDYVSKCPQYLPIMEHIEWNDSYVKKEYTNKDIKLYWWTSLRDMHTVEAMIYAEGLILLYHGKLTYEYLEVACLKIILDKAKDDLLELLDIDSMKETIHNTYNHIMENKEEILKADKDWRPKTVFNIQPHTHKKKFTKEEFIVILDECKELTGHKTYSCCLEFFIANIGLSKFVFDKYLKKYGIAFEEKEKRQNTGRKASTWPQYINDEEWSLSIKEIANLIWERCPWERREGSTQYTRELNISVSNIKKYKTLKMKEHG